MPRQPSVRLFSWAKEFTEAQEQWCIPLVTRLPLQRCQSATPAPVLNERRNVDSNCCWNCRRLWPPVTVSQQS